MVGLCPWGSFQTGAQLEPHPPDSCSGPGLGLAAGASQSRAPGDSDSQATAHWRAFFHPQPPGRPQRAGGPGPANNCSVQWVPEHQVTGGLGADSALPLSLSPDSHFVLHISQSCLDSSLIPIVGLQQLQTVHSTN